MAPSVAGAEELVLGAQARSLFEDRNTSTGSDLALDGVSFRGGPRLEVRDQEGDFTWDLRYEPNFEYYTQESSLSGWDHDVFAGGQWRIGPTTSVRASNRFSRYRSESRFNETLVDEGSSFLVERADVRRFIRNVSSVELSHQLAVNQQVSLVANHTLFDYSDEDRVDRSNLGLTGQYLYSLSVRNTVGVAASWRRQTFDEFGEIPERNTDFYNVSLRWIYRFDPTLTLNVSAGPTWVESDAEQELPQTVTGLRFPMINGDFVDVSTCPVVDGTPVLGVACGTLDPLEDGVAGPITAPNTFVVVPEPELVTVGLLEDPPSSAENRLTYFADISLIKAWEQWEGLLSYQRRDDTTSGLGLSTIADIGSAALTYRPSPRWTFSLRGSYVRQTQSQEGVQVATALRGTTLDFPTFQLTGIPMFPVIPGSGVTLVNVGELAGLQPVDVDADLRIDTWVAAFNARYRLTKRLTLVGELFYLEESQKGDFRTGREQERFRASLGFIFEFEPIRL